MDRTWGPPIYHNSYSIYGVKKHSIFQKIKPPSKTKFYLLQDCYIHICIFLIHTYTLRSCNFSQPVITADCDMVLHGIILAKKRVLGLVVMCQRVQEGLKHEIQVCEPCFLKAFLPDWTDRDPAPAFRVGSMGLRSRCSADCRFIFGVLNARTLWLSVCQGPGGPCRKEIC